MPRGRPKGSKNKSKITNNAFIFLTQDQVEKPTENPVNSGAILNNFEEGNIITPEEEKIKKSPEKPRKIIGTCDKCKKDIYSSFFVANLSQLTSKASWHRECKLDRINLCSDCASELNSIIDNWILKDRPEYKKIEISSFDS